MALRTLTGTKFTCFTGTKVQILTHSSSLMCGGTALPEGKIVNTTRVLRLPSLLALLVQKYKY